MRTSAKRSWDPTWEKVFSSREWGKYPPEELVRFIARNYYGSPDRRAVRVLDLGCGTGAATWYVAREGFSTWGIDGSPTAIRTAKARFRREGLKGSFRVGDFVRLAFPDAMFDCVIDIVALQHNRPRFIAQALSEARRVLKPGGRVFSMMISDKSRFRKGADPLSDKGFVHYFDRKTVQRLFAPFRDIVIETVDRTDRGNRRSHFVITART
ncbi:MAG: class I SAM-dependent methyltransferase [Elusimicrobia bacterium]|nr:class I SAM-dependent methyltransferase [Elusimicrobiota bacterium]